MERLGVAYIGEDGGIVIDEDAASTLAGVGDDDDSMEGVNYEIGAVHRRRTNTRTVTRSHGQPSGRSASKKRQLRSGILGLGNTSVSASSTGTLDTTVQEAVYLQRLVLDGDTSDFTVTDIKLGAKSLMSGTEAFPAGAFRPDATGASFSINKVARVGQDITVSLRNNNTGAAKSLSGMFKTLEKVK